MFLGRVFISGGAGFLGRAIMRRAQTEKWPCEFVIYSRDELKQAQAKAKYSADYVIGDVTRDVDRLRLAMLGCDTVIHTAAMKYIPEGEKNVGECIAVNVLGTQNVIMAAEAAGVRDLILVSTDKAVQPVNVYGASKMLVERIVGEYASYTDTLRCKVVRYGNVIGSTGSVIPLFKKQVATQGFVTVTDPDMTRYWMPVDHAIDTIIEAMSDDIPTGSIVVPAQMQALSLRGLAEVLSPATPFKVIGRRAGEKEHETIITADELGYATAIADYWFIPSAQDRGEFDPDYDDVTSYTAKRISPEDLLQYISDAESV